MSDTLMSLGSQFPSVLAGAKTGAPWALEALYRDLQPRLLRYLNSQAPKVAEDLASETWIGVAVSVPWFEGDEDAFRAFLFTVARRRVLDHRRKEYGRRTDPTEHETLEGLSPASDGEQAALDQVGTGWALEQIATLPPDQAEVVLLRVIGDLSVDEVASIVGKRPGTVRSLQLRALRRLARQLTEEAVTR
jgi:RNA polymerase sigma-70 factor, ECF subfamily